MGVDMTEPVIMIKVAQLSIVSRQFEHNVVHKFVARLVKLKENVRSNVMARNGTLENHIQAMWCCSVVEVEITCLSSCNTKCKAPSLKIIG